MSITDTEAGFNFPNPEHVKRSLKIRIVFPHDLLKYHHPTVKPDLFFPIGPSSKVWN
jgi:hypothetical protein